MRKKQESTSFPFFFLHASLFICLALCLCSCDTHGSQTGSHKSFVYHLWGTWKSNQTDSSPAFYSGTLVIKSGTITIDGYAETPAKDGYDANQLPFREFPKGKPLPGYSQDGKIFIEFPTGVQTDFSYSLTENWDYPDKYTLLVFTFGGKTQTLERTGD